MNPTSPGSRLRSALSAQMPLQIPGAINAYCALLAKRAGFKALYLSGAGVANASFGLPDLGMTSLDNVLEDVRRITAAVDLPLLVDADTGWGAAHNIQRTVRELIRAGAAACHIEDQVQAKRCGHRPGKALVPVDDFVDRIKAAVDGRNDAGFMVVARTDALASEGLDAAVGRAVMAAEAGADAIFAEACTSLDDYRAFSRALKVPVLANLTEFGKTPAFTLDELRSAGVGLVIYPLSAFRAMSRAAERIYAAIAEDGHPGRELAQMQSRVELYEVLDYLAYERKLDALFGRGA